MNCLLCGNEIPESIFSYYRGKNIRDFCIPVCSEDCLVDYLNIYRSETNREKVEFVENNERNGFKSDLEKIVYEKLFPYFYVEYEPYLLILHEDDKQTFYVPDFYLIEQKIFIEVKGTPERIIKARKFIEHIPLVIITPDMMRLWEWL